MRRGGGRSGSAPPRATRGPCRSRLGRRRRDRSRRQQASDPTAFGAVVTGCRNAASRPFQRPIPHLSARGAPELQQFSVMATAENSTGTAGRRVGRPFVKGAPSPNPGGRPKGLARATRELVGGDGRALVELWWSIA